MVGKGDTSDEWLIAQLYGFTGGGVVGVAKVQYSSLMCSCLCLRAPKIAMHTDDSNRTGSMCVASEEELQL